MAMFRRLSAFSPRMILQGMGPTITLSGSTRINIPDGNNADPCNPMFQGRPGFSTSPSKNNTQKQAAAIAGSYYDDPINVRYHEQVVCIEVSRQFNAINATRSKDAGLADSILIPGERSIFDTGMPTASMDGVVSTDCFPHIDGDTDSVMKEAARVLKRGSLMVFTTHLQLDTLDATALAKINQEVGVTKWPSLEMFKESGDQHGMELVEFEDQKSNLAIHYQNIADRIASVRGTLEDVDDKILDAKSARCNLFVDAGQRGLMIWGTFIFRKDEARTN